jgi:hypothetical protein
MGVRLRCANCHNHPLDQWTQDDYHGFAAIFAKVKRGRMVEISNRGEVTHPYTGQPAVQRLPGKRFLADGEDGRMQVAKWLTDLANPYFARSMANRLWRSMMGRGLVEPVDDLRSTNPPTHPQLLDALTADFVKHDYDLRHTLRTIANSAAYQRSSLAANGNEVDQTFYSHAIVRSLDAEVIADALADATGIGQDFSGARPGTRAVQLFDPLTPSVALDVLGRCSREEPCESSMATTGVAQALHLINGTLINQKVASKDGALRKILSRPDREVVNELYLRALGRSALGKELKHWLSEVKSGNRREVFEDLFWSLLSSQQFMTNH